MNLALAEDPSEIPPPPSYDTIEWEDERVMLPMEPYNYHIVHDLLQNQTELVSRFRGLRILATHIEILHDDSERVELFSTWSNILEYIITTASANELDEQLAKLILMEFTLSMEVRKTCC